MFTHFHYTNVVQIINNRNCACKRTLHIGIHAAQYTTICSLMSLNFHACVIAAGAHSEEILPFRSVRQLGRFPQKLVAMG